MSTRVPPDPIHVINHQTDRPSISQLLRFHERSICRPQFLRIELNAAGYNISREGFFDMVARRNGRFSELLAFGTLALSANLQEGTAITSSAFQNVLRSSAVKPTRARKSLKSIHGFGLSSAKYHDTQDMCVPKPLFATIDANQQDAPISKASKRKRVRNLLGTKSKKEVRLVEDGSYHISTIEDLYDYFNDTKKRFHKKNGDIDHATLLASLSVKGDTQMIGSPEHKDVIHPVVQVLHERRRQIEKLKDDQIKELKESQTQDNTIRGPFYNKKNTEKGATNNKQRIQRIIPPNDGYRIALSVEGGGMRGCVTAGMVTAIHYLGLEDTVDVVYGSSAGTVIGAYFITRQLPWFGPELYYDALTTAGDDFINTKRFLRAVGLGLLDPRLTKDVIFRRNSGKPVLDLTYLLNTTMQENKPLDWETFEKMQNVQPLKVIASGLKSEKAVILDMEKGAFSNIEELACCMRASCLLPGVAGPIMNMNSIQDEDGNQLQYDMKPRNKFKEDDYEPLADALLYEPLPYRSALKEGATHVICLRSRPDGVDVTGKVSLFEKLIIRRFLLRKNSLRNAFEYMKKQYHKRLYAEQVLELNDAAKDTNRPYSDTSKPHLLPVAVPPGSPEVTRLETGREAIFEGVRRGFARCYDTLVEDPNERGRGIEIAKQVFPDDILNYNPLIFTSKTESAYDAYLKVKELRSKNDNLHPSNDALD